MTEFVCQAEQFGARRYCGRCNHDWPGDIAARGLPCKPKADPPIGLAEMAQAADAAARTIMESQHVTVAAEFRTEPHRGEMRRAAVLMAARDLLQRVKADKRIMDLLKGKPA